jgi:short-subunit dehydrogenase
VARKFGKEGFSVAIVARNGERLAAAEAALKEAGISVKAFPCDLGDPEAVRSMVRDVRAALGPISVVHWNAAPLLAGDLTTCKTEELRGALDLGITGLITAIQEALPDLRSERGAALVTGGGFAFYDPKIDAMAVTVGTMGLALAKAAQHKAVGLLNRKLAPDGVYVGEVVVLGMVKGSAFDQGSATLEASDVANKFWEMHESRAQAAVNFP